MASTLNFEQARFNMIEQQVRPWDVLDQEVLAVMTKLRREDFVPPKYRKMAFADLAIPLAHGQMMLKPTVEGRLLQALELDDDDEVLHIGTGSGFFAACLAKLARLVTSVEEVPELADRARVRVQSAQIHNLTIVQANAFTTFETPLKFDAIVLTGAAHTLPACVKGWLAPRGRIVAVTGNGPSQEVILWTDAGTGLMTEESLFETDLPYLTGAEPPKTFRF